MNHLYSSKSRGNNSAEKLNIFLEEFFYNNVLAIQLISQAQNISIRHLTKRQDIMYALH